jgi:hypothetical protein
VTISLLLVSASPAFAKCKFQKIRKNDVANQGFQITKWDRFKMGQIDGDPAAYVAGKTDGEIKYLAFKFDVWKTRPKRDGRPSQAVLARLLSIDEGSKFLILLADESIVELQAESVAVEYSVRPVEMMEDTTQFSNYDIKKTVTANYPLDDESYAKLIAHAYTDLRITTTDGDRDYSKKKPATEIQDVLNCIQ